MKTKGGRSEDGEGLDSRHWLGWRACEPLFRRSHERMLERRTGRMVCEGGEMESTRRAKGDFELMEERWPVQVQVGTCGLVLWEGGGMYLVQCRAYVKGD